MSSKTQQKRSIFDDSDELSVPMKKSKFEAQKKNGSDSSKNCGIRKTHKTTGRKTKSTNDKSPTESPQECEPSKTPEKDQDDSVVVAKKDKLVLSPAQRARMEQNRQQALLIRQDKINRRNPYVKNEEKKDTTKVLQINNTKLIDTGAGFFIEENGELSNDDILAGIKLVYEPGPLLEIDRPHCLECEKPFDNSFLLQNFDHPTCDKCKESDDKHALIPKTDARNEYLLKDVDIEKREPPLKYILRKNPHNSRWGDMKLYLKLQVEKRALEVWGSEEAIESAMKKKEDQSELRKQKRFNKKMKELRMNVRSSLYTRATKNHEHEYDEEVYLPDEDEYSRTCKTCGHSYTFDKM
ncbi:DNA repair protein complementing XP-A cells-less [Homarus americanus]|uniref:DNA repair protein complementing XP-A cells-less n=2 Tax=Homarus americanus TaxID=6706 RepID=A0A8J5NBI1_HOMAM|nr:DNA repair protein complementing XP-A cells-less [Homarus americanus]